MLLEQIQMEKIADLIQKFAIKWDIKYEKIDYGVTRDKEVVLSIEQAVMYSDIIYQVAKENPKKFDSEQVKRDMEWFRSMVGLPLNIKRKMEENNVHMVIDNTWVKSTHMNENNLEKRYELIQKIEDPEFQNYFKEHRMKIMFGDGEKAKLIDEMTIALGQNGCFKMDWVQEVINTFTEEVNLLIKEIEKCI